MNQTGTPDCETTTIEYIENPCDKYPCDKCPYKPYQPESPCWRAYVTPYDPVLWEPDASLSGHSVKC